MKAQIYKPSKSSMQSARGKTHQWILEYELTSKRKPEPVMGWVSSNDTLNQVKMKFNSSEDAVAYAKNQGWKYSVQTSHSRQVRPRNYMDNFKFVPSEDGR